MSDERTDPVARRNLADFLIRAGRLDEAEEVLYEGIEADPRSAALRTNLVNLLLKSNRQEEAIATLLDGVSATPEDTSMRRLLAETLINANRADQAESVLRDGVRITPSSVSLREMLASLHRGQGRTEEALSVMQSGLIENPQDTRNRATLAEQLIKIGSTDQAEKILREGVRISPQSIILAPMLADLLAKSGKREDAIHVLRATVRASPENSTARRSLAEMLRQIGLLDAAKEVLREGIDFTPVTQTLWQMLFELTRETEGLEEALTVLRDAVAANHNNISLRRQLVETLLAQGLDNEAEAALREGVSANPTNTFLRQMYVDFLMQAARNEDAESILREGVRPPTAQPGPSNRQAVPLATESLNLDESAKSGKDVHFLEPPYQGSTTESDTDVNWSPDAPATADFLGRKDLARVIAQRLSDINEDTNTGAFLVHVDGPWGAGKSTLLNFLDSALADDFVIVRFDAWQQARIGPPWWALLTTSRREIVRGLSWWKSRIFRVRETSFRIRRTGAAYLLALLLLVGVTVGIATLFWPEKSSSENWTSLAKSIAAISATVASLWAASVIAGRFLLWDSSRGARLFEQSDSNPIDEIARHFTWLVEHATKPVAFFIDDLDRCQRHYVVDLLDTIQTLVREATPREINRRRVVFLVSADGTWLRQSYELHYAEFAESMSRSGRPLGYLFLDKLFQLSVPIPHPTRSAHASFLDHLLDIQDGSYDRSIDVNEAQARISNLVGQEQSILEVLAGATREVRDAVAGQAAEALASSTTRKRTEHHLRKFAELLDGNPRTTKRFLNTYSMLRSVRTIEGFTPSMNTLALWAILKVRWPEIADYLERYPEKVRGVVDSIWCSDDFPVGLRTAASSAALQAVVKHACGGPLTADLIRECSGTRKYAE